VVALKVSFVIGHYPFYPLPLSIAIRIDRKKLTVLSFEKLFKEGKI
jgi:hypothetical protein